MAILKESLTFDDVTLVPQFSSILPSEASVNTSLAINLNLKIPFISSAMDTVTESKMAIAMAKEGGLGIIHRNLSIKRQCHEVLKVKNKKLIVGAAIGTADDAKIQAEKFAPIIGRLTTELRKDVETVWIHRGMKPFGGGNNNLLIHTDYSFENYEQQGILEETLVHEAAHTSLDAYHSFDNNWNQAQEHDCRFISDYA